MRTLIVICLTIAYVNGHFILTAPPTRGMLEEQMTGSPCGGFNTPSPNRANWPLGTPIQLTSYHPNAVIKSYLSLSTTPASMSDFHEYSSVVREQMGKHTIDFKIDSAPSEFLQKLGVQGVPDLVGKPATVMTMYEAGDGVLYQCGDVTLAAAGSMEPVPRSSSLPTLTSSYWWLFGVVYWMV